MSIFLRARVLAHPVSRILRWAGMRASGESEALGLRTSWIWDLPIW